MAKVEETYENSNDPLKDILSIPAQVDSDGNRVKQYKKFNHMMDVAFSVVTEDDDPSKIDYNVLLLGLAKRLASLMENGDHEAFGHCDTYTYDNRYE